MARSPSEGRRLTLTSFAQLESGETRRAARPLSPRLKRKWRCERDDLQRTVSSVQAMSRRVRVILGDVEESHAHAERMAANCTTYAGESDQGYAHVGQKLAIARGVAGEAEVELRFQADQLERARMLLDASMAVLSELLASYTDVLRWLDENALTMPEVRATTPHATRTG